MRAAFLDRDGVVNIDKGYVYRITDFKFSGGIFNLCRLLQERQYQLVIITNQSGIARGYFTFDQLEELTGWMRNRFEDEGIVISKFYFCPHHPTAGIGRLKRVCDCRKPKPGMIFRARQEMGLNLKESLLIGDHLSDIAAGKAAGVGHNYLIGSKDRLESNPPECDAFVNLTELTNFLNRRR